MQAVGYLIRLNADEARLHPVDRPAKILGINILKLFGKNSLQIGKVMLPEGQTAANQVFPGPRLGLMDSKTGSLAQAAAVVGGVYPQFIEPVAAFVDSTENR